MRFLARAYLEHAKLRRMKGNVARALEACESALRMDASNPEVHRQYALNLMTLQYDDDAMAALRQVLALRPLDPTAMHLLNAIEQRSVQHPPAGYVERLFNRFAATFDQRMNNVLSYRVPDLLAKRISQSAIRRNQFDNTLDLGCGTGLAGCKLRPFTRRITGVDLSGKMLEKASEKAIYDVLVCDDITHFLTRCNTTFDLITAADVFIYIDDLTSVFRLVQQRLKPAGIFAFSIERTRGHAYRLKKSGRFAHSAKYIRRLAKENGITVLSKDRIDLRLEHHQWVKGDLILLGKHSHEENQCFYRKPMWGQFKRLILTRGWMRLFRHDAR
jgi:predicted TPR repeat methyltransferase